MSEYLKILAFERWRKLAEQITIESLKLPAECTTGRINDEGFLAQRIIGGQISEPTFTEWGTFAD